MTFEHPADVLTDLVGVLGEVLRIQPEKIDPEQSFKSLELDSMLVVEFVAVVNSRYGLRVRASDLYDHPTPASFAREVERAMSSADARPATAAAATTAPGADLADPVRASERVPDPAPAAQQVVEVLREQLAAILCCDARDIDAGAPFNALGMDSMVGAEFIAAVNRSFGMRERSVLLYEHPNLTAMADYIAARTGASAYGALPARAPEPASPPAAPDDLDVLLDAVRDDRISVDEALVLLARRG